VCMCICFPVPPDQDKHADLFKTKEDTLHPNCDMHRDDDDDDDESSDAVVEDEIAGEFLESRLRRLSLREAIIRHNTAMATTLPKASQKSSSVSKRGNVVEIFLHVSMYLVH